MLFLKKAKVDVQDTNKDSVLHWAVAMESIQLVKFVVEELGVSTEIANAVISSLYILKNS